MVGYKIQKLKKPKKEPEEPTRAQQETAAALRSAALASAAPVSSSQVAATFALSKTYATKAVGHAVWSRESKDPYVKAKCTRDGGK